MGPNALLAITSGDLDHLLEATRERKRSFFDMGFFRLFVVEKQEGEPLSILGPFLGAPHAVMGMEKIIALGAKRIFGLGWCGSLQPDLRIGDYVIPTDCLCEEGTSSHYPIGEKGASADSELSRDIDQALSGKGKAFKVGTVWTTDAPYRETPSKVRAYQEKGVLAVDMEMSALMNLAIYRSVRFAGLLVVSDELSELKWRPGFRNPLFKEACRHAGQVLVEVADSLHERIKCA